MSMTIGAMPTLDEESSDPPPEIHPHIAVSMDQFWKYIVVECAEYGFSGTTTGPPGDTTTTPKPRARNTVFSYFFGKGCDSEPMQTNDDSPNWLYNFNIFFGLTMKKITRKMIESDGVAMHMYSIGSRDNDDRQVFRARIKQIPGRLAQYGLFFKNDQEQKELDKWTTLSGAKIPQGLLQTFFKEHDTTLTAQTYPDELEVNAIFDEMYLGLLSHVEASENILSITSSTLVTTHSSPGDWCLFMRSNSHTDAVLKILRLPLLLNEMVTDHVRNAVRFLVAKLLAKEDPLGLIG
jgi:hypothetical protein